MTDTPETDHIVINSQTLALLAARLQIKCESLERERNEMLARLNQNTPEK